MAKLICIEAYREGGTRYQVDQEVHLDEADAARLMRGAPSAWRVDEGTVRLGGPDEYVNYNTPVSGAQPAPPVDEAPDAGPAPTDEDVEGDEGDEIVLDELTVPQLRDYAAERGIDITGKRRRADIIIAIEMESDDEEGD